MRRSNRAPYEWAPPRRQRWRLRCGLMLRVICSSCLPSRWSEGNSGSAAIKVAPAMLQRCARWLPTSVVRNPFASFVEFGLSPGDRAEQHADRSSPHIGKATDSFLPNRRERWARSGSSFRGKAQGPSIFSSANSHTAGRRMPTHYSALARRAGLRARGRAGDRPGCAPWACRTGA